VDERHYAAYRELAQREEAERARLLDHGTAAATPRRSTSAQRDPAGDALPGSDTFDKSAGASRLLPATTQLLRNDYVVRPEDMRQVRRIMQAVAEAACS